MYMDVRYVASAWMRSSDYVHGCTVGIYVPDKLQLPASHVASIMIERDLLPEGDPQPVSMYFSAFNTALCVPSSTMASPFSN